MARLNSSRFTTILQMSQWQEKKIGLRIEKFLAVRSDRKILRRVTIYQSDGTISGDWRVAGRLKVGVSVREFKTLHETNGWKVEKWTPESEDSSCTDSKSE